MGREIVSIKKELTKYINSQVQTVFVKEVDKTARRYWELHPSSFPWCGLQQAWEEANGVERKPLDFYGEYYTGLGTLTHELMQRYLGYRGSIIGYWQCMHCRKKHKQKKPITAPDSCKSCGHPVFEYHEIGIKFGKYTYGHVDGVIKLKGKYYVIDYKTTSPRKNEQHKKFKNVYPYKKNVAQIESYVVYLEQQYGIKIDGWFLIYVSRDNAFKDYVIEGKKVSEKEKKALLKKLTRDDKLFGRVLKLRKGYNQKYWDQLVKYKPCKTNAEYKDKMHSFDMCPLALDGTCFNPSRLKRAIKNLNRKTKIVNEI